MLKKHMAACLVATAFAAAPVWAQTPPPPPASGGTDRPAASGTGTTTSGSSAMQPSMSGSSTGSSSMQTSQAGGSGQFMTQMQQNQMMASSLIGTTVVSANNESIGDVNDVILDRNGQTMAVVIGVGGFLGIGEKDVAVPFQALDFNAQPQATAANTNPPASTTAPATTGSTASNTSTATTGNTGNSGTSASANASNNSGGVPDRVVLKMTKAELQGAPAFQASNRGNNQQQNNTSGTPAPKQ
jgi:sporulation protein YlmC with PRC-barrel domain